ncbi:hypothetical protein Ptr902_07621 [Pyrenophora tritici-repentis]|nr:hypothetical protein Ptr902_07621 [Pyrenophora tritici-repentis]
MASSKQSTSNNKDGFKQKATREPQPQTPKRPNSIQKKKKTGSKSSTATESSRKAQTLRKYGMEGTRHYPIVLDPDFVIKVEDEGTVDSLINIDTAPPRHTDCIPALKDPGKPRGYLSMTDEQRESYDYRYFKAARDRDREAARKCKAILIGAGQSSKACRTEDKDTNDKSDEHNNAFINDDEPGDDESTRSTSPHPIPTATPLSPRHLNYFVTTFRHYIWLDTIPISTVVAQVNAWTKSHRGFSFSDAGALCGLQELERKGEIRVYDDKVFFPKAFHLLLVDARQTEEIISLQHPISPPSSSHTSLSTDQFTRFRNKLSKLVDSPAFNKDNLLSTEEVWQAINRVSSEKFNMKEVEEALVRLSKREEVTLLGGKRYFL